MNIQMDNKVLRAGEKVLVTGFHPCANVARHKLLVLGLTKGVEFIIKRVTGAGELFEIELRDERFILRKQVLDMIVFKSQC